MLTRHSPLGVLRVPLRILARRLDGAAPGGLSGLTVPGERFQGENEAQDRRPPGPVIWGPRRADGDKDIGGEVWRAASPRSWPVTGLDPVLGKLIPDGGRPRANGRQPASLGGTGAVDRDRPFP